MTPVEVSVGIAEDLQGCRISNRDLGLARDKDR